MAQRIGVTSPEMMRTIVEVVRYLRSSGFIISTPLKGVRNLEQTTPIYVRNDSGVAVPPFACLQATGTVEAGGQNYITIDQPADTTGDAGPFIFNGFAEIAATGDQRYGIAHDGPLCRMLTNGTAMTSGDKARPVVNQWYIELGGELFTIVGDDDIAADVVRGVIGGGGGGGGEHGVIIKTPAGGIAARSGTTVSSASCDVFSIVGTTLTDTGNNIDVFNISISSVGGSKYGLAKKEYATGKWVIDFEDCS